jgi:hypothetical protein
MIDIRPLKTEADYDAAPRAIEVYFDSEPVPGSPEADRFDLLALMIADYERRHWAIEAPDAGRLTMRADKGITPDFLARLSDSPRQRIRPQLKIYDLARRAFPALGMERRSRAISRP